RAAGARRGRWGYSPPRAGPLGGCRGGLTEIVDIVNNFPGQAQRGLVAARGRGAPRWLDLDRAAGARRAARRRRGSLMASALGGAEGVGPLQGSASKLYSIQLGYAAYRRRYWNGDYSAWRWRESSLNAPGRG